MATEGLQGSPKSGGTCQSAGNSPSLAKRFKQEIRHRSPKFTHGKKTNCPKKAPSTPSPKKVHSPRWCRSPKTKRNHAQRDESSSPPKQNPLSSHNATCYGTNVSPNLNQRTAFSNHDTNHNATHATCPDSQENLRWDNNNSNKDAEALSNSTTSLARPSLFRRFMNWQHSRHSNRNNLSIQSDLDKQSVSPQSVDGRLPITPTSSCVEETRSLAPPSPRARSLFSLHFKRERFVSAVANTKNKFFHITGLHRSGTSPSTPVVDRSPQVSPGSVTMASASGTEGDPEKSRRESVQEWLDNLTDPPHQSCEDLSRDRVAVAAANSGNPAEDGAAASASGKAEMDDLNLGAEAKMMKGDGTSQALHASQLSFDMSAGASPIHTYAPPKKITWEDRFGLFRRGSVESSGSDMIWESVDNLLQERTGDPEEMLTNLGFVSKENQDTSVSRIPHRFLQQPSAAPGIDLDRFVETHTELREMLMLKRTLEAPTPTTREEPPPPLPDLSSAPKEKALSFFNVALTVAFVNRFNTKRQSLSSLFNPEERAAITPNVHYGLTPSGKRYNSILHPDNSQVLAETGIYDDIPNEPSLPKPAKLRRVIDRVRANRKLADLSGRLSSVDPGDAEKAAEAQGTALVAAERSAAVSRQHEGQRPVDQGLLLGLRKTSAENRMPHDVRREMDSCSVASGDSIPERFRKQSSLLPQHLINVSFDGDRRGSSVDLPVRCKSPEPSTSKESGLLSVPKSDSIRVSSAPDLTALDDDMAVQQQVKVAEGPRLSTGSSPAPSSIRSSVSSIPKGDPDEKQGSLPDGPLDVVQHDNSQQKEAVLETSDNACDGSISIEIDDVKVRSGTYSSVGDNDTVLKRKHFIPQDSEETLKNMCDALSDAPKSGSGVTQQTQASSLVDHGNSPPITAEDVKRERRMSPGHTERNMKVEQWLSDSCHNQPAENIASCVSTETNMMDLRRRSSSLGVPECQAAHRDSESSLLDWSTTRRPSNASSLSLGADYQSRIVRQDSALEKRRKFSRQSQVSDTPDDSENAPLMADPPLDSLMIHDRSLDDKAADLPSGEVAEQQSINTSAEALSGILSSPPTGPSLPCDPTSCVVSMETNTDDISRKSSDQMSGDRQSVDNLSNKTVEFYDDKQTTQSYWEIPCTRNIEETTEVSSAKETTRNIRSVEETIEKVTTDSCEHVIAEKGQLTVPDTEQLSHLSDSSCVSSRSSKSSNGKPDKNGTKKKSRRPGVLSMVQAFESNIIANSSSKPTVMKEGKGDRSPRDGKPSGFVTSKRDSLEIYHQGAKADISASQPCDTLGDTKGYERRDLCDSHISPQMSAPCHEVNKKQRTEYGHDAPISPVESAILSSFSGRKQQPRIVSYVLGKRDGAEVEGNTYSEEFVFRANQNDSGVINVSQSVQSDRENNNECSKEGWKSVTREENVEESQNSATKKKMSLSETSKVQQSFELEEINSEDMVLDNMPALAARDRRNLRGPLVRTGSAQSDSSGFVEADTLDNIPSSELDWGRLKVAHLDSSGSEPGPEATNLHGNLTPTSESTQHSFIKDSTDTLSTDVTTDTPGNSCSTVTLDPTEAGCHSNVEDKSVAQPSDIDGKMGIAFSKDKKSNFGFLSYMNESIVEDEDDDNENSPSKKAKKFRKRSKTRSNSERNEVDQGTKPDNENIKKLRIGYKSKEQIEGPVHYGDGLDTRFFESSPASPRLKAELFVDPLLSPPIGSISHVSEVRLVLDEGQVRSLDYSMDDSYVKPEVRWCVNYGVHEVFSDDEASEHSAIVTRPALNTSKIKQKPSYQGIDSEEYMIRKNSQEGIYEMSGPQLRRQRSESRSSGSRSNNRSRPQSLADELELAESKESTLDFPAYDKSHSRGQRPENLNLRTSTPRSRTPPPKPPRSPRFQKDSLSSVSCLHLNVQSSPEGSRFAPHTVSSPSHTCPPLDEKHVRQHNVLCSLLKHSGNWSPALADLSSRSAWDYSEASLHDSASHVQFLLDQAQLLQHAVSKYKKEFQEVVSQTRYIYDNARPGQEDNDGLQDLLQLSEAILCEVWELEGHLASRIDDIVCGREHSDIANYSVDLASLNVMREVIELLKEQMHHRTILTSMRDEDPADDDDPTPPELVVTATSPAPAEATSSSTDQMLAQLASLQKQLTEQHNMATLQLNSSIKELRRSVREEVHSAVTRETQDMRIHIQATERQVKRLQSHLVPRYRTNSPGTEHIRTDSGLGTEAETSPRDSVEYSGSSSHHQRRSEYAERGSSGSDNDDTCHMAHKS